MKAAQIAMFGPPEVVRINDVPRAEVGDGHVLVAVDASSVNGHDALLRSGAMKILTGRQFPMGVGLDFAGVVAATGAGVTQWTVGDRVWGLVPARKRHVTAAAAEYVVVHAQQIGFAPANVSAVEAASLVVTGTAALKALRDVVRLVKGERVLVRGAAGGVGTAAVQLAAAIGGRVTALARQRDAEFLTTLGADQVFDYTKTKAEDIGPFDVIIDAVGTDLPRYRSRLAAGGRMVTAVISPRSLLASTSSRIFGARRIRTFTDDPTTTSLDDLATYVTSGALRAVVDQVYPLEDIAAAHRRFAERGHRGKPVITVSA